MAGLAFHVLGPLELLVGDRPVPITSTRQRIVAATLVMASNHMVSVDRLIEAVWDGNPPSSARNQIQICVSALRRVIGVPDLIDTWPSGYGLRALDEQIDYHAFDAAVNRGRGAREQGRLEEALGHFDAALGLWRGPALAGVPGRAAGMHASMLEERRLMAVEDRIEVRLGLGAYRELVEELVALTAEYPLRERLWGLRMIVLYRCGRQAEALDAYRTARSVLVDELGIEPGEQLRRIEHAILNQDSSLDPPGAAAPVVSAAGPRSTAQPSASYRLPRQLPGDIPDFTPRGDLVETLQAVLARPTGPDAAPAPVPVALITGPAGCGKSALALRTAHCVRDGFPDGQLYADLRGSTDGPLPTTDVLALFLRALGVEHEAVPMHREERIALFRSCVADRRVLIMLDDAADEQHIRDLLPGAPGPAVLVTSRSRLCALPGAHVAELGVLSPDESARMLERIAGPQRVPDDENTARLAQMCGGLPLALRICAMRLAAHPHWTVATLVSRLSDERHRLDELSHGALGVRPVLASVYGTLKPGPRELLDRLCLLDAPDVSALTAAALLDSDVEQGERLLDELVDARILHVDAVPGRPARYSVHLLTRIFVREQLAETGPAEPRSSESTAAVERAFGCLLAVAEEAHRRVYGGSYSVLHGHSPRWPGAKQYLDQMLDDPIAWVDAEQAGLSAAVRQAAALGLDEFCWELAVITVGLREYRGLLGEGSTLLNTALGAVKAARNQRGQAAVLASLGLLGDRRFAAAEERMLLDALAYFVEHGDELGQAFAVRTLAHLDQVQGRPAHAARRYERALERFRVLGDTAAQAHVVSALARAYLDWGNVGRAEALAKESLLLSQRADNRRLQADALYCLGEVLVRSSHTLVAEAVFQESFKIIRRLVDPVGEAAR
jgi:DNA-binding SARP family transcriptional activator